MRTEKIVSVELENDNVIKTIKEIYEPRYEGFIEYDECECDFVKDDFKEHNKVWCKNISEGFELLDTGESWEPKCCSVEDDIESFQKYLDDTYGKDKYEAYALGAYVHGAVSFSFNKGEDTRCRWDSGTCGFVGINKEFDVDLNHYASTLSDAWNGSIERMYVYDNYEEEEIDSITSLSSQKEIQEWQDKIKEKYGVENYEDNNKY